MMPDPGRALPWMLAIGLLLAGTRWVVGARGMTAKRRQWAVLASSVGVLITAVSLVLGLQKHPLPPRPGSAHPVSLAERVGNRNDPVSAIIRMFIGR